MTSAADCTIRSRVARPFAVSGCVSGRSAVGIYRNGTAPSHNNGLTDPPSGWMAQTHSRLRDGVRPIDSFLSRPLQGPGQEPANEHRHFVERGLQEEVTSVEQVDIG